MKKIFSICFIVILTFILDSCTASLPSYTSINSQYFSITTPSEKEWDQIKVNDLENKEIIYLQKGHGGGNMSESDYPIKTLIIQRRKIQDDTDDIELLRVSLNEIVQSDIKIFVDDLSQRFFLDDFKCLPSKSKDKLFYQYTYNVSIHFDSLAS